MSFQPAGRRTPRILVINPNTSKAMTDSMRRTLDSIQLANTVEFDVFMAPEGPDSIDGEEDLERSTEAVLNALKNGPNRERLSTYDGILIACYSSHDLVPEIDHLLQGSAVVTGIFEASILTALSIVPNAMAKQWGIVTTGQFWERHLETAVNMFLGLPRDAQKPEHFAGVYTTGLNAGDFEKMSEAEVREKMADATAALLDHHDVGVVIMGCAGMAGLENIIRRTSYERFGIKVKKDSNRPVCIVDPVKTGVMQLEQAIRAKWLFQEAGN